mmetsp:Transcript_1733/g.5734  ORF Transcript_1733/g.5734 Transcript_1733/m.5734 type:complete len:1106 (+) Transcript_1733:518-3835(+)
MSFNWLILINWAIILNPVTKAKRLVVVVNWVCFATFHNWWKEGRVWLKGYVKGRYYRKVGAASADDVDVAVKVTFLSLYEKGINAILPLVSLDLREKWAPTPREVLEEARDGPTAPDSIIAAEFDIPYSGLLGWLGVVWYFGVYWLWISTYLGFQDALRGGGAPGSTAELVLAAMDPGNGGRPIGGGGKAFVEDNLFAIAPYEPCFGLYRLSEKVMHDVWVKVRSSWWRIVAVLLAVVAICGGFAYQFHLPTKDVVVVLLVVAAAVALFRWTMPIYDWTRAERSSYSGDDLGHVGEVKMDSTGSSILLNGVEGKEREAEADYIAVGYVPRGTLLEPRPACPLMVALLLVLFGALGIVLDYFIVGGGYRCGLAGAIFGGVVGFVRFGRKQYGVPEVIVVSAEALRVAGLTGMLFAAGGVHGQRCSTLEVRDGPPEDLKTGESWEGKPDILLVPCDPTASSIVGKGRTMIHETGWKVYVKPSPSNQNYRRWQLLASTHEIKTVTVPQLNKLVDLDALPKGTIVRVPATDVADAALKVVAAANAVKEFPPGVPWKKRTPTTFRNAHYEVRDDPKRQVHQHGVDLTLRSLRKAGARAALCRLIGVALAFLCSAAVASWCGLGSGVLTACVCVVTLGLCLPRIMGASVDMLSEAKHSVTVKYRRGPRLAFYVAVLVALVVAALLFVGFDSLGIASSCGLFAGVESSVAVLVCGLLAVGAGIFGATRSVSVIIAGRNYGLGVQAPKFQVGVDAAKEKGQTSKANTKPIVINHASCTTLCFIHSCKVGDCVEVVRLVDGCIFDGHVVAVNVGDGRSIATTYDVSYENGVRENGVERHRIWIKGGRNVICSVVPTTDEMLNQKLCDGFLCTEVMEAVFADVHATTQHNYWVYQCRLPEHLQRVMDHSFCTLDKLPTKIAEMIEPHLELVESSCTVSDPVVAFFAFAVACLTALIALPGAVLDDVVNAATACRFWTTPRRNVGPAAVPPPPRRLAPAPAPSPAPAPTPRVRRSCTPVSSYVESDDDENGAAAPPKDSRVAVLYAGGQWYEGTVVDVLDGSRALVRFDNYETANQVNFASAPFRITRFGPEPVPQRRGKRKAPTSSRPSKRPRRS